MSASSARRWIGLALGAVMVGLGLFIALRLIATGGRPLSPSLWLDVVFALFFLLRGGMHFRALRRP